MVTSPIFFSVTSPGKFTYYSQIGFWAIGSGETHALGSFFNSRNPLKALDRQSILYRVCEAKFNAENAVGVGETTCAMIVYPDGSRLTPTNDEIAGLKEVWKRTRILAVPTDGKAIATSILMRADQEKFIPAQIAVRAYRKRRSRRRPLSKKKRAKH
jgi:hypothetical protein